MVLLHIPAPAVALLATSNPEAFGQIHTLSGDQPSTSLALLIFHSLTRGKLLAKCQEFRGFSDTTNSPNTNASGVRWTALVSNRRSWKHVMPSVCRAFTRVSLCLWLLYREQENHDATHLYGLVGSVRQKGNYGQMPTVDRIWSYKRLELPFERGVNATSCRRDGNQTKKSGVDFVPYKKATAS